jgi:hypothetical protein
MWSSTLTLSRCELHSEEWHITGVMSTIDPALTIEEMGN